MQLFGINFTGKSRAQSDNWAALLGEGMRDLLPKKMQQKLTVGDEFIDVALIDNSLKITKYVAGVIQPLGEFDFLAGEVEQDAISTLKANLTADTELHLSLSSDDALIKEIDLPIAAAKNLKQTVGYEITKYTPFNTSQIYYDVVPTKESESKVHALLSIVQKKRLDTIISSFAKYDIKFNRAIPDVNLAAQAAPREMNLLPISQRRKTRGFRFIGLVIYLLIIAVLLAALFLTPLLIKRNTAIMLEQEMSELAVKATGERDLWIQQADKLDVIDSFTADLPVPFSVIIEDFSRRLNSNTYVSEMQYQTNRVILRGKSTNASLLTDVLKNSPFVKDAVFQSSIVSLGNGVEGFRIAVTLYSLSEVEPQ